MCLPVSQRGLSAAKRSGCRSRMMLGVRVPILLYYFYSSITVVAFAGPHLTRIGRVFTNMKKGKIPPPYAYNAPCPLCTVGPSSSCPMRNHHNPLSSSSSSSSSSTALTALPLWTAPVRLIALRGGEVSELATGAYEWCMNLGGPSAVRVCLDLLLPSHHTTTMCLSPPHLLSLFVSFYSVGRRCGHCHHL